MKKLTVAQIVPTLNSGGVERGAVDLAKFLAKKGHEPIIISAGGKMAGVEKAPEVEENATKSEENGAKKKRGGKKKSSPPIIHMKLPVNRKNPLIIWLCAQKLVQIIQLYEIDIIHSRSRIPAWCAFFIERKLRKLGIKCHFISTIHGPYSTNLFGQNFSPLKIFYNSAALKPKYIIAVSNFIKNYIEENYQKENLEEKEIRVIHRGVDINYFNPENVSPERLVQIHKKLAIENLDLNKKIIFFPARFSSWKGHEFLIDALAKLKTNQPHANFLCLMVGKIDNKNKFLARIKKQIFSANLNENIRICDAIALP